MLAEAALYPTQPPEPPSNSSGAPVYVIDLVDVLSFSVAIVLLWFYGSILLGKRRVVVIASRRLQNYADQPIV